MGHITWTHTDPEGELATLGFQWLGWSLSSGWQQRGRESPQLDKQPPKARKLVTTPAQKEESPLLKARASLNKKGSAAHQLPTGEAGSMG